MQTPSTAPIEADRSFRKQQHSKLGPLETQLLNLLSQRENVTIHDLMKAGSFRQAYTTVATTLNRLTEKGLVKRVMVNRVYHYSGLPGAQLDAAIDKVTSLLKEGPDILAIFVDAIADYDSKLLDQLADIITARQSA